MFPMLGGLAAALILFAISQFAHNYLGHHLSGAQIAVDLGQWLFAGLGIAIFIRSRELAAEAREMREERDQ